jgi:Uma2 family endonuclease
MAEPVKTAMVQADAELEDDPSDVSTLLRWVERPDGRMELRETPLTPEDYLDPQEGDTWVQGARHNATRGFLAQTFRFHFHDDPQVLVTEDLKFLFGRGLPQPAPDVAVVRGVRYGDRDVFDVAAEGVPPCLIIEVVSPKSRRIRKIDVQDKVDGYRRAGVPEYIIVDRPVRGENSPFELIGYRLDAAGRNPRIEPHDQGRLLAETINIWIGLSPDRQHVLLWDAATGERILSPEEAVAARDAEIAARDAEIAARDTEIARLRAELERLRR